MVTVMPEKQFKIPAAEIKPLAEGRGACYATDLITVEGQKVGYMYREKPDSLEDSGWRFFFGKGESGLFGEPESHSDLRCEHDRQL